MKRFQSISENLSYNDILQLDGAFPLCILIMENPLCLTVKIVKI